MTARDDYPMLNVIRQDESEDEMWPTGTVWFKQHQDALNEIDNLRYELAATQRCYMALTERAQTTQEMSADLWDELMAWHFDDCPFPDTPIGTSDDRCICHRDIAAKWPSLSSSTDHIPCDGDCAPEHEPDYHAPMCPRWQT